MSGRITHHSPTEIVLRVRPCMKCGKRRPMKGYLEPSGWWRALERRCKPCKDSLAKHSAGRLDGEPYPDHPDAGDCLYDAESRAKLKGVENKDKFRLGWANRMKDA